MSEEDRDLEWSIIEAMMGEPTTISPARWRDVHGVFYRKTDATARVMYGNLWIEPLGIVYRDTHTFSASGIQRTFRNGWVLAINDQAVTKVGEFADVMEKLNDPAIRKKLGLIDLTDGESDEHGSS